MRPWPFPARPKPRVSARRIARIDLVLPVLRFTLALVFAAAAAGKLLDLRGSRAALAGFGVPAGVARVAGTLLPLAELALALALIPAASARWAAIAALVLLLAFMGGIANALRQGRAPDCHCFGQLHSAPAGAGTLARNAVLAVLAVLIVWSGPGPTVDAWLSTYSGSELAAVVAGAAAVALALLSLRLWVDNRRLRRDLDPTQHDQRIRSGLPIGAPAPGFTLPTVGGRIGSLDALRARGQPIALVFMAPGCGPCRALLPDLERWRVTLSEALTIAVISRDAKGKGDPVGGEGGLADVLLQKRSEVSNAYRVPGTPSAVVVSPAGRIASAAAAGTPAIEALIRLTLQRDPSNAAGLAKDPV